MEFSYSSLRYNIALRFLDHSPPVCVMPGISADAIPQPPLAWRVVLVYSSRRIEVAPFLVVTNQENAPLNPAT